MSNETHEDLKAALKEFLSTRELEEGRELPPDAPTLEDRRANLNAAWWSAVRAICLASVPKVDEDLLLGDQERALIDFGLFDSEALDEARHKLDRGAIVEGVVLMHDSLAAVLDDALRRDAISEYQANLDTLQRDIDLWPETHLVHIRYRDARVNELLGDNPRCAHVLRLFAETDEKLEQYKRLEIRDKAGSLPHDDHKTWGTIRHFVESRREQIAAILSPLTGEVDEKRSAIAAAALAASEAVEASVGHLLELHGKRRGLEQQILEQQAAARRVTDAEVKKAVRRELDAVAGLLRLAARYAHVTECAVPVDSEVEYIDPNIAADSIAHILRFDPRLIDNPLAARFGPPELLLAPGVGDGVYDSGRNRWVVPQRCTGSAIESLAHAAIMYRLEVDATELNKALLASYRESIPANRSVRANLKLRNGLVRDYVAWMASEAIGEDVLPRETREWFERHIAPNKEQPWVPYDLRGRSEHQLVQALRESAEAAETAEREYRAAVIEWLLDPRNEATIRERVLPRLNKAIKLDAGHRAAVYSAAALQMQLGEFQKAISGFRRFTEIAPTSWWTRKAIELCAQCR
ncbi:MAG: hypothetical protein KDB90_04470 [Planctomycetes bacterium]|nr:hypothetical protein [Planctomycetota bacterium]